MRTIPIALRQKLLNRFKSTSTDSEPKIKLIATQTSVNSLLSEPIHEDILPALGDVAVRQMVGDKDLALAYAICLDEGTATIYRRLFPAGMDYKWEYWWTLGEASDVAIEYDGTWEMNPEKEWYFLRTLEFPEVFFVRDGDLYVQYWNDETTRTLLAEDVSGISSCKGWSSSIIPDNDQGLIIGYLRDGRVFYRNYCRQEDGGYSWEAEHEVTELGDGNSTLSVIRTNDFRIGFLTENNGEIHLVLTRRNYAGMSIRPETLHVNTFNAVFQYLPMVDHFTFTRETLRANSFVPYFFYDDAAELAPDIQVTRIERLNREETFYSYGFKLYLDKPLHGTVDTGLKNTCTITPSVSVSGLAIASAEYSAADQAIIVYTNKDVKRTVGITLTIGEYRLLWYDKLAGQKWFLPQLTAYFEPQVYEYHTLNSETLSVSTYNVGARLQQATFLRTQNDETLNVSTYDGTIVYEPVSDLPL